MRTFVAFRETTKTVTTMRGTPVVFSTPEYAGEGVIFDNGSVSFRGAGDVPVLARSFYDEQQFREAIPLSDLVYEGQRTPVDGKVTIKATVDADPFTLTIDYLNRQIDKMILGSLVSPAVFRGSYY
jgi:hypothetical protein